MSMSNKIFCTAPFTTMRIETYATQSTFKGKLGTVYKPGCVYNPDVPISSLDEYLNGADMTEHRNNLCNGTIPRKNCFHCSETDRLGLSSIRQQLLKKPWASDEKKIRLLDIMISNTCNLGCVMCNADSSSYINLERFNAGIQPKLLDNVNNIRIALDAIDALPDLVSVSFIGGEFFAEKENKLILDKLIERNIGATIVTNGSIINSELLNKLKQVNNLEMRVSIDGTGYTYEFIRYPAKWETLKVNLKILKENLPRVILECNTVIQPLNLQNLHELYQWANQNRLIAHHQILVAPPYLGWGILNTNERQQLKELLQKKQSAEFKLTTKQSQSIIDISESLGQTAYSAELREQGVNFISKLCKYRKLSVDTIQKQFGILDNFANEILLKISQL